MMKEDYDIDTWLALIATALDENQEPTTQLYNAFIQHPTSAFIVVEKIAAIDEQGIDTQHAYYSACIFALDVCVAQLQAASENGNKQAERDLHQLMDDLAAKLNHKSHTLLFWLPILNAFYDVHVELSPALKDAYLDLVDEDDEVDDSVSYINSIRELIHELSDLTVFDIAEHFFAQSYAMPADFFSDLLFDLFSIDEGQEIGLLALLHPDFEVREVVIATLDVIFPRLMLSSLSLTRLKAISYWYPPAYQDQFAYWIKEQRLKEVVFEQIQPSHIVKISASEIDGGGAQGLFLQVRRGRKHRMCGLLLKYGHGIKDAWVTPYLSSSEMKQYQKEVFNDDVMVREVNFDYFKQITQHFLHETLEKFHMPDLHVLELQEELGEVLLPEVLDVTATIEQLAVQIDPFTPDVIQKALKRSKHWFNEKTYAHAWFVENAQVDKLVNRYSAYENGVKTCRYEDAIQAVFEEEFETNRDRWLFHFLWVSLWLKAKGRKNQTLWKDIFLVAYTIHSGTPLRDIPIMQVICHHSVLNSVETMQIRRTHLNQE